MFPTCRGGNPSTWIRSLCAETYNYYLLETTNHKFVSVHNNIGGHAQLFEVRDRNSQLKIAIAILQIKKMLLSNGNCGIAIYLQSATSSPQLAGDTSAIFQMWISATAVPRPFCQRKIDGQIKTNSADAILKRRELIPAATQFNKNIAIFVWACPQSSIFRNNCKNFV